MKFFWSKKHFWLKSLLFTFFLVFASGLAFAQEGEEDDLVPPVDQGTPEVQTFGPSVGTFVPASLETSGYMAQSQILDDLSEMIAQLGSMLYVLSFFGALFTLSLLGNYRAALWFIAGPALFLWLTSSDGRVQAAGVPWQLTSNVEQETQREMLGRSISSRVSWAFHWYNNLVSSAIQNVVRVILDDDQRYKMKFTVRQRITDEIFRSEIKDTGLGQLVSFGIKQCATDMNAWRQVSLGERDPHYRTTPEYSKAKSFYDYHVNRRDNFKPIPDGPVKSYIQSLISEPSLEHIRAMDGLEGSSTGSDEDGDGGPEAFGSGISYQCRRVLNNQRVVQDQTEGENGGSVPVNIGFDRNLQRVDCLDIWCFMAIGAYYEGRKIQREAEENNPGPDSAMYREIWRDIAVKLADPNRIANPENPEENLDLTLVQDDTRRELALIPIIIGGHLLKKQMTRDHVSGALSQFASHAGISNAPFNFSLDLDRGQWQSVMTRYLLHKASYAERWESFVFASLIPYLQGVILYALSLTFPFFVLMVLIPGKATAFFSWMALWAWAKSWDIGWALLMVVDSVLWDLMPHSDVYNPVYDPNDGPISLMQSAFSSDPSFSLAGYYFVMGTLLTSIPIISAHAVMGAKKAVAGTLVEGLSVVGKTLGSDVSNWVAHEQLHTVEWFRETGRARYALENKDKPANAQLASMKSQADAGFKSGTAWRDNSSTAGTIAMVGGGVLAGIGAIVFVASFWTGVGALAGAGLMAAGARVTAAGVGVRHNGFKTGTNMRRKSQSLKSYYNKENASRHYYNYQRTKEFRDLDALRSVISDRIEHWNTQPFNAAGAFSRMDQRLANYRSEMSGLRSQGWTGVGLNAAVAVSNKAAVTILGTNMLDGN